ncbi:hypothetical protein HR52_04720 [Aeromonas hydrophila]|nr:hypothetical protein HR52_04720 [Aeromonas hydrophila]OCA67458.1 hypothetical protein A9R12_02090 [Aeromonas hydrophila]OCY08781.1 hypothetical protein A9X69_05475 [Aeromonas hydrophila]OCY08969.1 hypothetical protein A9X70_09670 [Aeromonas hydrophila]
MFIMMLNQLKNTMVCWMPAKHMTVVHFITIDIVLMYVFISVVTMRWMKIYNSNDTSVLK